MDKLDEIIDLFSTSQKQRLYRLHKQGFTVPVLAATYFRYDGITEQERVEIVKRIIAEIDKEIEASQKCGYGVPRRKIGYYMTSSNPELCVGCHFLMEYNVCSWTESDGVDEINGPTTIKR